MIAIDTETTGVDFFHGAMPFYFSSCDDTGTQVCYEWTVCPFTRRPDIPEEDIAGIRAMVHKEVSKTFRIQGKMCDKDIENGTDGIVLQNAKFDAHALATIGIKPFPWSAHHDTLLASHLLASNEPHDLTNLADIYLGEKIAPLEKRLEGAVKKARDFCRRHLPEWRIASDNDPMLPSAKEETWRFDYWLPRTLMLWWSTSEVPGIGAVLDEHSDWWTVLSEYANKDTEITLKLWYVMQEEMHRLSVWDRYMESRKLPRIFYDMEVRGVSVNRKELRKVKLQFQQDCNEEKRTCLEIAHACGYDLELPKGGAMNNSLFYFCFDHVEAKCPKCAKVYKAMPEKARNGDVKCKKCKCTITNWSPVSNLDLPIVALTDGGSPSFDSKRAIPEYMATLDGEKLEFVRALASSRKYDKAVESMVSYEKYGVPLYTYDTLSETDIKEVVQDFIVLHPSNNQTATKTLRTSQQNPNGQQVSKQESTCPICNQDGDWKDVDTDCWRCKGTGLTRASIRTMFCPAPGRIFISADFENLELRIPAYKAPEPAMIELFERPNDAPYFGSNHLLVAHKLHPRAFEQCTSKCPACSPSALVCDVCHGEQVIVDGRVFKKRYKDTLYQYLKNGNFAIQYGAQEELADRTFRVPGAFKMLKSAFAGMAKLNQRLMDDAAKYGYVKTALGYPLMVQRTEYYRPVPTQPLSYFVQGTACEIARRAMILCADYLEQVNKVEVGGYYMILYVHDEIVFDMPADGPNNLAIVGELRRLMCLPGDDVGVPLTVNVEIHKHSWGKGETLK